MQTRWNDAQLTTQIESKVWTASSTVRRYLHLLASGDPNCDWPTYVRARHLPDHVNRVLVLGCGSGWLERALAKKPGIGSIVACDFAPAAVQRARKVATDEGLSQITYQVVNLEREALPAGPYDAIFANDVLHHIMDLEGLYGRAQQNLKLNGKFIFNEYVGPNRFQYSDEQMDLINRYMRLLPDRLRYDPCLKVVLRRKDRVDSAQLEREDPTEAVRSEDVLPLARQFFRPVAEYPYGGSILNHLLYEIIVNFDESNTEDAHLLQVLCDAEDRLIRSGHLEPDFWIFVGARRGSLDQNDSPEGRGRCQATER